MMSSACPKKWGYTMIKAVYDACVLYSASLRDILLRLAEFELVVPLWSEAIRNEWTRSLFRNRPELKQENLERTCRKMDSRFPCSLVQGYESILSTLQLPDPNDRHVLAAAIHAEAKCIVTINVKHFPKAALLPYGIEALLPDEFVSRLIQENPIRVLETVKYHRSSLTRPSKTVEEYLATLEKQGLFKTVAFLREHKDKV